MFDVAKRNKNTKARKLAIYDDGKKITEVVPYGGWYFFTHNFKRDSDRLICRQKTLENLYWLIGKNCDYDEWEAHIEKLDKGKGVDDKTFTNSQFFNIDEKLTALNSFKNI